MVLTSNTVSVPFIIVECPLQSAWQIAGWKTKIKIFSTVESEFWRNAGPNAFQLQETMFKSVKM